MHRFRNRKRKKKRKISRSSLGEMKNSKFTRKRRRSSSSMEKKKNSSIMEKNTLTRKLDSTDKDLGTPKPSIYRKTSPSPPSMSYSTVLIGLG
jgi:chromatin remodeling complex protein RSC6